MVKEGIGQQKKAKRNQTAIRANLRELKRKKLIALGVAGKGIPLPNALPEPLSPTSGQNSPLRLRAKLMKAAFVVAEQDIGPMNAMPPRCKRAKPVRPVSCTLFCFPPPFKNLKERFLL